MRICRLALAFFAGMAAMAGIAFAAEPVDLLLVLTSDVSRSVDAAKFKLQRDGYISAINNPRVIDAIRSGPRGRIAVCFADRTSISGGIDFAMAQLERAPFRAPRRTIDVSGDGTNNSGRDVTSARDDAVAQGVTINGLVILSDQPLAWNADHTNPPGGLEAYYRNNVAGGPNAFVLVAENFNAFSQAILNKLIAEVADSGATQHAAAAP
jgi:hypothetical protein